MKDAVLALVGAVFAAGVGLTAWLIWKCGPLPFPAEVRDPKALEKFRRGSR